MYSKCNSREDYITLLDSLETLTTELREEIAHKRQRQKKTKQKETQFNHGPANIPQFPNVATRSRGAVSATNLSSLMLRSHLKPGPFPSDEAESPSVSQETTIADQSSVAHNQSETTHSDHEDFTLKAEARPASTNTGVPARDKLKQEIERCEKTYRGKTFIVNGDERSETVFPDEISGFFSRFQEGTWLANFNLMPLLFSFRWAWTTLVLPSSYTSALKNGNQQSSTRVRWPLRRDHDRIILPCCIQDHWTLYDVDLKGNSIRHYNSLAEDISELEEVVSAIKERLAHAMHGWESPNRDFTIVSGVSEDSHPCISHFSHLRFAGIPAAREW
jgi:hypothetical protein